MNTGRKKNLQLKEYIRLNWQKMTDAKMSNNQDYDCTPERVKWLRYRMKLVRTPEHLANMYDAIKRGSYNAFPKRGHGRKRY